MRWDENRLLPALQVVYLSEACELNQETDGFRGCSYWEVIGPCFGVVVLLEACPNSLRIHNILQVDDPLT